MSVGNANNTYVKFRGTGELEKTHFQNFSYLHACKIKTNKMISHLLDGSFWNVFNFGLK